jgi:hypothetical protein
MPNNELGQAAGQLIGGTITDTIGLASRTVGMASQRIAKFHSLPPIQKERKRASYGIGLLAGGLYVFHTVQESHYASIGDMVHLYIRGLQERPEFAAPYFGWTFMIALGIAWTVVGLLGSRGPRDVMSAYWALFLIAFLGAMLAFEWYPLEILVGVRWFLKGIYLMALAASMTGLYLSLRGPGPGAARAVDRWIASHSKTFRRGRKRSF